MLEGENIRRISAILRYFVIGTGVFSLVAVTLSLLNIYPIISPNSQAWFAPLWASDEYQPLIAGLLLPKYGAFFLTLYWLQNLFSAYQHGEFFSARSIQCYNWLVWTQIASYFYELIWPPILSLFVEFEGQITLDISDFVLLTLLAFVTQVLSLAKKIQEENQEFI